LGLPVGGDTVIMAGPKEEQILSGLSIVKCGLGNTFTVKGTNELAEQAPVPDVMKTV
jgi:hypothetical protein